MKRFFIVVLLFALAIQAGSALSADLSSNIMRRVNTANQSLDKAEDLIKRNQADLTENHLRNAREEYANIARYYGGSYDPDHPDLVALQARIETVSSKVEGTQAVPQTSAPTQAVTQAVDPQSKTATTATPPSAGETSKLIPNITRLIGIADGWLDAVKKQISKGYETDATLSKARAEYDKIFKRYPGMFDPNHPDIIALKARIDEVEREANAAAMARMGSKPVESGHTIVGMAPEMGEKLSEVGVHLSWLDGKLADARKAEESAARYDTGGPKLSPLANYVPQVKRELESVERLFAEFNRDYSGRYDPNHESYVQVKARVAKAKQDVAVFMADVETEAGGVQKEAADKHQAEVKAIMGKYKNIAPTGKLHAANPGRMVWADQEISISEQDKIKTRDTFKLTDPVFGRVFLHQSLGNTPVYSSGGGKPGENYEFRYEFRLFIDDNELVDKFGVFVSSKLNGEAGQTWTTWQFAPNPEPYDDAFKNEADAWRKVTQGLTPGEHKVRFELWGVQGQFKSREAVSVGEFTLLVGKGDRVGAGAKFPGDSYSGADTDAIRDAMMKALVGPVAKSGEILKVAVTSSWKTGVYSNTKRRYRTISGAVLWQDKDDDGVCRFTTYNFVSDHLGGKDWAPVKYKSFCLNCPEGDVECPK